ncbi:MAG TPA: hypothetical protein VK915_12155 [Gaiellaceae bacterium]|nr:hypothetical protein [Gaiellaceae bacterium]
MDTNTTLGRGRRRALVSSVVTDALVAVLLAGTAGALPGRNRVDRDDVQRSAITSTQIKDGQVKAADLARPEQWRVVGKPELLGQLSPGADR